MKPVTQKYVALSADRKKHEYHIPRLSEAQQEQLEELMIRLETAGAKDPLSWALSETREGINQFARFLVLKNFYLAAYDIEGNTFAAEDFDPQIRDTYAEVTNTVGAEKLQHFLQSYGKGMIYQLLNILDEGNFADADRDGISWQLMKIIPAEDKIAGGINGLHEDFIEFDTEIDIPLYGKEK